MSVKSQVQLPSSLKMNHNNTKQRTARRVVKKYRSVRGGRVANDSYWRLKKFVPTIKSKENISKLDVVLEAISYIQTLECNLRLRGYWTTVYILPPEASSTILRPHENSRRFWFFHLCFCFISVIVNTINVCVLQPFVYKKSKGTLKMNETSGLRGSFLDHDCYPDGHWVWWGMVGLLSIWHPIWEGYDPKKSLPTVAK